MGGVVFASGRLHACVQHGACRVRAAERRFLGDRREDDRAQRGWHSLALGMVAEFEGKARGGDSLPVAAGLDTKVAQLYGMIHPGASATATVRAVFLIDPKRVIGALL